MNAVTPATRYLLKLWNHIRQIQFGPDADCKQRMRQRILCICISLCETFLRPLIKSEPPIALLIVPPLLDPLLSATANFSPSVLPQLS